jgi:hypothetical protein
LVRLDVRVNYREPAGPAPDTEPKLQGAFARVRLRDLAVEVRLHLPVIDALNEAAESQRDSRLPGIQAVGTICLGLYPVLIAVLVLFGSKRAETIAAWAPIVLVALLIVSNLVPRGLRALYTPLLKATDATIFGLIAALLAGLVGGTEDGLSWRWWIVVAVGRLLASIIKVRPNIIREYIAGEHRVAALFQSKRGAIIDPLFKQGVVSSFASDLEVDLTDCGLPESPAKLYLDVWFSRVTIRIRPNWSLSFADNELLHLGKTIRAQPLMSAQAGMPSDLSLLGVLMFSRITLTF